jgi:CheY-like chemotaxis protein
MNILVVEDDDNKRHQLVTFLIDTYRDSRCVEAKSYQSGLKAIIQERYDIVFLDMTMPTFDRTPAEGGGRIRPFAGRDIFAQIASRHIEQRIIVFTMFEVLGEGENQVTALELDRQLRGTYDENYIGLVYYNAASSEWKGRVKELIDQMRGNA